MKFAVGPHLLMLMSGAAALVHQTLWTRRLVDLLGAGGDTFARVVGAFFVGLSLGGALAALRPVRPHRAWRRVAVAEIGVGLLSLPALASTVVSDSLRGSLPLEQHPTLTALLLLVPPSFCMGWVLPAAITASGGSGGGVSMYVANTAGGVLGVLGAVLVLLPGLGLLQTGLLAVLLNLAVAAAAFWFSGGGSGRASTVAAPDPASRNPGTNAGRTVAFASGFLALGFEVLFQHQVSQVTINSGHSSAFVLAWVIAALTVAAAASGRLAARLGVRTALVAALLGTALLAFLEPTVFLALRPGLRFFAYSLAPSAYLLRIAALSLAVIVPVFLLSGLLFPLLLRASASERNPQRETALLLALNGLGGWLGAEAMEGALFPALGLWTPCFALGAIAVALGGVLDGAGFLRSPLRLSFLVVLLGGGLFGTVASRRLPQLAPEEGAAVVEVRTGRDGVVAAVRKGDDDWRLLFNNTYTLGGSRAQANQERQALLPLLLHGHARSVGVLGFATGSTAAGATLDPGVESVEAFELSGDVLRLARTHFGPFHRGVFTDPKVRIHHQDARLGVLANPGQFDVVVGDLFLPWRTGEGRLFSREHFTAVRHSLRKGGVFCQWLPLFQLTRPQFETIARTFRTEFPDAFLVRGDFYAEQPIVGLVGGVSFEELDWDSVTDACRRVRTTHRTSDALVRHPEGVAMLLLGPVTRLPEGPVNSLDSARLEWDAGRNVMGLREPWFIGVPYAEYVRDVARSGTRFLPGDLQVHQDTGQFFLTLEIAAKLGLPARGNLEAQLPNRIPPALQDDFLVDWRLWPSRVKPFGGGGVRAVR